MLAWRRDIQPIVVWKGYIGLESLEPKPFLWSESPFRSLGPIFSAFHILECIIPSEMTHTDLKPENILLAVNAPPRPSDFPRQAWQAGGRKPGRGAGEGLPPKWKEANIFLGERFLRRTGV